MPLCAEAVEEGWYWRGGGGYPKGVWLADRNRVCDSPFCITSTWMRSVQWPMHIFPSRPWHKYNYFVIKMHSTQKDWMAASPLCDTCPRKFHTIRTREQNVYCPDITRVNHPPSILSVWNSTQVFGPFYAILINISSLVSNVVRWSALSRGLKLT